jgi:ketosteroid isomerase-like protein
MKFISKSKFLALSKINGPRRLAGICMLLASAVGSVGLVSAFPAAAHAQHVGDLAAEEAAITAVLRKQTRSYFQRSYEGEADVWAHQPYIMRMTTAGEPGVGWDTIGAMYKTFMEENPEPIEDLEFTHTNVHLQIHGDGAWVVYEQHLKGKAEGETFSSTTRQVRFLARIDGKWKIVYQYSRPLSPEEEG